jgi:hypothetical protein
MVTVTRDRDLDLFWEIFVTMTVTNDLDYKLSIDFIGLSQTNTILEKVLNRANQYWQIFRTFSKNSGFYKFFRNPSGFSFLWV